MKLSTATGIFGKSAPALLCLLVICLAQPIKSKAQTRNQLQRNVAPGYNYQSCAFRKLFYLPEDTLATADSGAIAFKGGTLWLKRNPWWTPIFSFVKFPDDIAWSTTDTDCVDTSFVSPAGSTFTRYERKMLPQFIGLRIRAWGPALWPLLPYDNGIDGTYYSWNPDTGELKIFWTGGLFPCGGQPRQAQVY